MLRGVYWPSQTSYYFEGKGSVTSIVSIPHNADGQVGTSYTLVDYLME